MPKKETKANKYFYIISVLVALLVIGITISASFAFFTNSGSPTGTATVITSGSMSLELVDGDVVGITQGMIPGQKVQKKFKVRNTGTLETKYDIYLSEILNTFADKSDLVYRITSTDGGYNSSSDKEVPSSVGSSSKIVPGTSIGANEEHNYILEIEFLNKNENQDDNKGKKFSAKIQINDYKELVFATLDTGSNVNTKLKQLANPQLDDVSHWTNDENVVSIQRANQLDNTKTPEVISSNESTKEVYAWYDNQTIYYYTEANMIYLNEDSASLFRVFKNLNNLDLSDFDTSKVGSMSYMFNSSSNIEYLDLSNFDTTNVTDMSYMFQGCSKLANIDISSFRTPNVEDLSGVFYGTNLKTIDLSNFDTSNVTSTWGIFGNDYNLEEINISNWDFTKNTSWHPLYEVISFGQKNTLKRAIMRNLKGVKSLESVFYFYPNLEYVDLSGFDSSVLVSLEKTFYGCSKLTEVGGLNDIDTSNVTEMRMLFQSSGFEVLDISNWNTSKVTSATNIFSNMDNIRTIYVGANFDLSNAGDGWMFYNDYNLVGGAGTVFDSNHVGLSYAHVDGGVSNPGYLTLKETIAINENGYNYWTDNYSERVFNSTSASPIVFPNYTNFISENEIKSYIRTTFENANPTKHDACIYYNNKEYCIEKGYWEAKLGNVEATDENAEALGVYLKNDIESALEINGVSCFAGEFLDEKTSVCVTSDEKAVVGAVYGGTVLTIFEGSKEKACIVNSDGSAYCEIY